MKRYFFNTFNGRDTFDAEGTMCASLDDARLQMLAVAKLAIESEPGKETWSVEALDERGKVIGSLDFGLLTSKGQLLQSS